MTSETTAAGDKQKRITEEGRAARRRLRHLRRGIAWVAFGVLFTLLSISSAVIAVCILGPSIYRWHGFAIELRLLPDTVGQTRLVLRPLGEVSARTHRAPVALVAALEEIQVEEIKKLLTSTPRPDDLAQDFEKQARADLRNFVLRQLVLAAVGGLGAPLLLRRRRFRAYAMGGLIGFAVVGSVLTSAISTFNGKAFETPAYTGTLKQAPWVIQFGKDAFTKIEALSQKLRTVATNLNVLYGRIATVPDRLTPNDPNTFHVLHVSDLHNNPAALDFLRTVADQFKVEFIVDTGDLTDFGSPPETVMVRGIARLPYPYVFVAGNHDSHAVMDALAKVPNVTVLNGQVVTVQGVTLLGLPNPASARAGVGSVDTTPAELQAGGETLLRTVQSLPEPPDILAIHDPEEARPLWGVVPLILCGHEHRYYIETQTGSPPAPPATPQISAPPGTRVTHLPLTTVICNAGTTGAAGLRYFEKEKGVPFSCAVLTFLRPSPTVPNQRPQLRAIDLVVLNGSLQEYSISHYTFNNGASTPAPPAP